MIRTLFLEEKNRGNNGLKEDSEMPSPHYSERASKIIVSNRVYEAWAPELFAEYKMHCFIFRTKGSPSLI